MRKKIQVGNRLIGDGEPCFIIAEVGINHNGCVKTAKQLIDIAVSSGCSAVKFQKRTVDVVYTQEELERVRPNPFGETNGDLKRGLEFGYEQYREIDEYCKEKKILWFASCWDEASVDFIEQFNPPCYKISSASLTDDKLLLHTRATGKPILLSTGMSTQEQIDHALKILGDNVVLYHCTSTYPTENNELNLNIITNYRERYDFPIGYSGHERGVMPSVVAAALGANSIERHITLDRTMWGTDHAASLEPEGLFRMVRDVKLVPTILGTGNKVVYESEKPIIQKLRRVDSQLNAAAV